MLRPLPRDRFRLASGPLLVGAVVAAVASCGPPAPPATSPATPPNILIAVLDACRADRLGAYGYSRETSPAVDAFAADPDAVIFRHHYVQGTWTKTSTASLFTGLFPFQHDVYHGVELRGRRDQPGKFATDALERSFDTLAERLSKVGYHTFGLVKSQHLIRRLGFSQGFEDYWWPSRAPMDELRVAQTVRLGRKSPKPFFAYLHVNACHYPFEEKRRDPDFMARYGPDVPYDEAQRRRAGIDFSTHDIADPLRKGTLVLEPQDMAFLQLLYDANVRRVDRTLVAPLMEGLRRSRLYDDTLIVLTADHGEELWDHHGYAHGHALWDEIVHVPLIVKFPKGRKPAGLPREVTTVTQSIDLMPALLAVAGAEPDPSLPGGDLFACRSRGFALAELSGGIMLVQPPYKLIDRDGTQLLFDLEHDPLEQHDLAAEQPERVASMQAVIASLRAHYGAGAHHGVTVETSYDQDAVEELRSLGYVN